MEVPLYFIFREVGQNSCTAAEQDMSGFHAQDSHVQASTALALRHC
jgi:hypothetical protein